MFSDENLAAAQLAQIFGSELLNMQTKVTPDSNGSAPQMLKLDPKQFLLRNNQAFDNQKRLQEQQLILKLQREAEMACPLPPSEFEQQTPPPQPLPPNIPLTQAEPLQINKSPVATVVSSEKTEDALLKINDTLLEIKNSLQELNATLTKVKCN